MNKFCQVWFGCESKEEADKIADLLLNKKLIACADGFAIDSKYQWNDKRVDEIRYQIVAYSTFDLKDQIISEIKNNHNDELPSIVFIPIDANKDYLEWLKKELD